ncbi:hypothetical protein F5Y14DRAFT_399249 [Nemania sp. NC0429]|nr:hypothetical protein F5Y14DRAFT_399249 [Nemania sp. NC0429]
MSTQDTQQRSRLDITPDVLLHIIEAADGLSQINLALAYPEIFLQPAFDIFVQDAEKQIRRYNSSSRTPVPFTEMFDSLPLLLVAIENDVDVHVIDRILKACMSVCPTSVDGIWGEFYTALPPPLTVAAAMGKTQVLFLLLEMGADPTRRCGNYIFPTRFLANRHCQLEGSNHDECVYYGPAMDREQPYGQDTYCLTPLMAALAKGYGLDTAGSTQALALEDCAMVLYGKGARLPLGDIFSFEPFLQQMVNLTRAEFVRFTKGILDSMIMNPRIPSNSRYIDYEHTLHGLLFDSCFTQKSDDNREMIEYLVDMGGLLVEDTHRYMCCAAATSARISHWETATYLVDKTREEGHSFDFRKFSLRFRGCTLPYVQAVYRLMQRGNHKVDGVEVSTERLHCLLLKSAMEARIRPAVQWLRDQGCMLPITANS